MASHNPPIPPAEDSNLSPREIKYRDSLTSQITSLESTLANLSSQISSTAQKLENPPKSTIQQHIKLLHDFNEIRDVGLHLIGMIADERGVGLKEVLGEFGVTEKD
ncbi:hypothetical protein TWF481_005283 [Arthrobotrys musiformis]|uniref:Swi5-domain-containing protein n=1 Tax=Arthrobotrys musiformis TaxID=47236 RepID=A0AAV9WDE3_9PEZI